MRTQKWTEEKIDRWIKEGRGQGEGSNYRPWLTVHDVPGAKGRCHRPWSPKFGRKLELLSDVEYNIFQILDCSPYVIALKEQYPIDRKLSQQVAARLGIRHPTYPGTHVPCVMTVDFLATFQRDGKRAQIGIDAKRSNQLEDASVIRKLQLTRACLAERGHEHLVICEKHLPKQLLSNLQRIRSARPHEDEHFPYPNYLEEVTERLYKYLSTRAFGATPLRVVCQNFDELIEGEPGTALRAARLLIDSRRLQVDLLRGDIEKLPMSAFRLAPEDGAKLAVGA